jgi:hypothetical protein
MEEEYHLLLIDFKDLSDVQVETHKPCKGLLTKDALSLQVALLN